MRRNIHKERVRKIIQQQKPGINLIFCKIFGNIYQQSNHKIFLHVLSITNIVGIPVIKKTKMEKF